MGGRGGGGGGRGGFAALTSAQVVSCIADCLAAGVRSGWCHSRLIFSRAVLMKVAMASGERRTVSGTGPRWSLNIQCDGGDGFFETLEPIGCEGKRRKEY